MSEEVKKTKNKNTGKKSNKNNTKKKSVESKTEVTKKEIVKEDKVNVDKVKNTSVKKGTSKKKNNSTKKKVVDKSIEKEIKLEEKIEVIEEVKEDVKHEEVKKKKKKHSNVLLIVFGCLILFLLFACVIVRKWYLPTESYSFDYLNMRMIGYTKEDDHVNRLVSEDDKCIITVTTEFTDEDNLDELGTVIKIKDKEWARQDFENGSTLLTYHKDMLYIVQMYAIDEDVYKDTCKESFEKVEKTFKFLKSE